MTQQEIFTWIAGGMAAISPLVHLGIQYLPSRVTTATLMPRSLAICGAETMLISCICGRSTP